MKAKVFHFFHFNLILAYSQKNDFRETCEIKEKWLLVRENVSKNATKSIKSSKKIKVLRRTVLIKYLQEGNFVSSVYPFCLYVIFCTY